MSGPENTFIASVHRHLPKGLYRIKNHNVYSAGQPDCWYSGPKGDLWAEFKHIVLPKRGDTVILPGLSPLQVEWLSSRHREGRSVGVIIGSQEGGVWLPGLTWAKSFTTTEFRDRLLARAELAKVIAELVY